jgi:hypothetical protein
VKQKIFSDRESTLLRILGKKKLTIEQLTNQYFLDGRSFNRQQVIGNAIRSIQKKCEFYKLPWRLSSNGGGRGGKTVWKEKV